MFNYNFFFFLSFSRFLRTKSAFICGFLIVFSLLLQKKRQAAVFFKN
ncbi:hypothetical protein D068_cds29110 [Bacillus atrophaeus UCMB-5137]|nr:hypothetical protein D068_cds29110 [Bacillus atrophaeus UCMB-5137]